jgi:hypothetical protein
MDESNKQYAEKLKETYIFLTEQGFFLLDEEEDGTDIWRQGKDKPKMDIEIKFIRHLDNL